jgi:hypothetical protein
VSTANDLWHRLLDPLESDEDLSVALTESRGTLSEVATYSAPFELRKLHLIFSVADSAVASEDARVCTFHLAKVSGGSIVDTWDGADFTALVGAIDTFWPAVKPKYPDETKLDRIKVYKAGPDISPPQIPVYDAERDVAGTAANGPLPPQVAVSVTEMAGSKLNWGRFYLPNPSRDALSPYGRIDSTWAGAVADAVDTMYEAWKTAGLHPVVYRAALPAREKKNGVELPARAATAWDVETIQIDDVFDIIRSRRFKYPTLRTQRAIA